MKSNYFNKILVSGFLLIGLITTVETVQAEDVSIEINQSLETLEEPNDEAGSKEKSKEDGSKENGTEEDDSSEEEPDNSTEDEIEEEKFREIIGKLEKAVEDADEINLDTLVEGSKEKLVKAIKVSKSELNADEPSRSKLNDAYDHLLSVRAGLIFRGDSSDLKALVAEARKIDRNKLTDESDHDLNEVIMNAESVLDDGVSQEALDEAFGFLDGAMKSLDYLPEDDGVQKTPLTTAIMKAEAIDISNKTNESKERFLLALKEAKALLDQEDIDLESVDAALLKLETTQGQLKSLDDGTVDQDRLNDEDIIGKEPEEVLPETGVGSLGLLASNAMILSGLAFVYVDKKNRD